MSRGLRDWLRSLNDSLSEWYGEAKGIWSNLGDWVSDAPVVLQALFWISFGLFSWLRFVEYFPKPQLVVRGTGVILQLFGFILAAYGLERTLEKLGQVPSTNSILMWLRELRTIRDTEGETAGLEAEELRAHLDLNYVRTGIPDKPSDANLEERVKWLEEVLKQLRDQFSYLTEDFAYLSNSVDERIERLEELTEKNVDAVEEEVQEVWEKVKELNIGREELWLEWCGVSFFVYGVPLTSFPYIFLPAYRVFLVPIFAGGLLRALHWYAD